MEQPNFQPKYNPFDIGVFIAEQQKILTTEPPPDIKQMTLNAPNGKQGNGFILTCNNFTHTPEQFMEILQQLPYINRINFQIEKGQSGTIHYQAYTHHTKQIYWGQVRRNFLKMGLHRVRIENRIKSPHSADEYCSKVFSVLDDKEIKNENWYEILTDNDGMKWFQTKLTPEFYTWGELPNYEQGKRNDIQNIIDCVRDNMTDGEIMGLYPTAFFHNKKKIDDIREIIRNEKFAEITRDVKSTFITGLTRIGKNKAIILKHGYKNVFVVDNYKHPFDKYKGQDVIVFDEFHSQIEITQMLRWLDIHPLILPCRYSDKQACFTKVYFTSNEKFTSVYPNVQREKPNTYNAFMARIHYVYDFNDPKQIQQFYDDIPRNNPLMPEHLKTKPEQIEMIVVDDDDLPF